MGLRGELHILGNKSRLLRRGDNNEAKPGVCACSVMSDSFETPWTVACQVPLSMEFSRQGYWSGLRFPSLGDLPNSGIEPGSPALQADSLPTELQGNPKFSPNRPVDLMLYKSNTSSSFF